MNSGIAEAFKAILTTIFIVIFINIMVTLFQINQINNYEAQVTRYIQTAGGVTPEVMEKADKLSKNTYSGHFTLEPNDAGPVVYYGGKYNKGVYPKEWSTDTDRTPIYPIIKRHKIDKSSYVTDRGCLMTLLDHPNKLFAGDFYDFQKQDDIPDYIDANKVHEIKPIGYIKKNYFFKYNANSSSPSLAIWSYQLLHEKTLTNQDKTPIYAYENRNRKFSNLLYVTIDADDPKVQFNDKSLHGKQDVMLTCSQNNIYGDVYKNNWGDMKANSYPHDYGATIKYQIKANIPYLMFTEKLNGLNKFTFKTIRNGIVASNYRDLNH